MDVKGIPTTLICRLRIPLPKEAWIRAFSEAYPEITIEVLSHLPAQTKEITVDLRIHGEGARGLEKVMAGYEGVREVELVAVHRSSVDYRVVHTTTNLLSGLGELHLMPRFPFIIQGGQATWIVVSSETKVRKFYAYLKASNPKVVIESLRHGDDSTEITMLTHRQRELFARAMSEGYFEVPRKISLTDLAAALGLAKSTLSESLAVIEEKLLKEMSESPGHLM